jgi:serine/threonine protein kinase/predicted Zn-dependent protease
VTLSAGTKLGRYEIRSKIGAGGMGQVYLARDTSELDRTVAIKLLPVEVAADPKRMQRFVQEARTVSALNHPNILTIHEFGREGTTQFIATEYVEGVTLREHSRTHRFKLDELLDTAIQIATALDAAHEARVVHRDIKPDNIMIRRRDRIVKVLDFGLAKPVEAAVRADPEASTRFKVNTEPGALIGTVSYMSPEQSAASPLVDHRTDIWSLGVLLYEMIGGRLPFEGKDMHRQIIAIQEQAPLSLSQLNPAIPDRLEEIVMKALAKNPDERYQTARDLLIDLRNLKRRTTSEATAPHQVSSAEYVVKQVKLHKRAVMVILGSLLLISAASSFFYLTRTRAAALTDKDTILLTEFENKTGEDVFDGTLRRGLAVQLQQSPFLDIFPEERVRTTLRLMSRSPDERVTRAIGREICQRQGLKAYITGAIAKFDRNYSLTLEALNSQTGDSLAIVQVEAEGKDQVLKALSRAATELREKLGESLGSIQKFDASLEVTTSSLDALKDYASGRNETAKGQDLKSIEFYRRALEKDPHFALAWLSLAGAYGNTGQFNLSGESVAKAYALRDRVSESERARITMGYYGVLLGELDKASEVAEEYMRNYPREAGGPLALANYYSTTGQPEKALAFVQEGLRRKPDSALSYGTEASLLMRLNRYAEAGAVLQHALGQKLDGIFVRQELYNLAFLNGDAQAMQEQIAWASGTQDEHQMVALQVDAASFAGEWRKSQEHLRRGVELALRAEDKENAANYSAWQAAHAAFLGQFTEAVRLAEAALGIARNREVLFAAALAFALSGESSKAQPLMEELQQQYPRNTPVNQLYVPEIKAALALHKGDAQAALDLLEPGKRFESWAWDEFWQKTLRTMAYLKLRKGAEASAEARKVVDHRAEAALSLLWPLAHLNLARASAMQGDTAQAKQEYEEFFKLWQNADSDLPILIASKREYAKLKG